jgi:hypothetical protein
MLGHSSQKLAAEFVSQTLVEFLQTPDNRSQTLVVYSHAFVLFLQKCIFPGRLPSCRLPAAACSSMKVSAADMILLRVALVGSSFLPETRADSFARVQRVLLTSAAPGGGSRSSQARILAAEGARPCSAVLCARRRFLRTVDACVLPALSSKLFAAPRCTHLGRCVAQWRARDLPVPRR